MNIFSTYFLSHGNLPSVFPIELCLYDDVCHVPSPPQSVPPLEFTVKNDRISIAFVEAIIFNPMVAKGSICKEMKVFPSECRGRRCSYKGKLVVRTNENCM